VKIAFVITRSDDIGGAQIHVRDLSTALRAAGHDAVVLAGANGVLADELRAQGVPYYSLDYLGREVGPLQDVRCFSELRETLRDIRPDIISTHSTKAGFIGRIAGQTLGIPTLFTAHGWGFTDGRPPLQMLAFWAVERTTAAWAARIITVCESDRTAAVRARVASRDRLVTIHNAMPDIDKALRAGPGNSPARLVMVARLSRWKDQPTLLHALAGLKDLDWQLELIGDGPLREPLEALTQSLDLTSRVTFLGYRGDVPERLAQAQVFLLISKWEGFPRSILEAMRAGLPVVASDVGGVQESVVDGTTGFVIPRGDTIRLRECLRKLITSSELRVCMGEAGRTRYEEKFTFDLLVERTTRVYESVLRKETTALNPIMANTPLNATRCPICGAADSRRLRRGYYVKCTACKAAFRQQRESVAELDEYWQKEFWTDEEIEKRKNRAPVFRDAFALLHHQKPKGGSVLDIGCGIGTFLAICRKGGWKVTGVEPSAIACEVARREYGLELINEPFSSAMFQGKKFDAIFAAQVLHHLPDPAAFVAEIDRVLADDGVLILRTPNLIPLELSLFLQRLLGREREFFCGPALYTFHPHTLSLLFRRLGYREVTFVNSRPYLETPAAPWQPGQSTSANLRRLAVAALKLAAYGAVESVHKLSNRRVVVGPSIFVIARKK
jgi:glycosyltransferase involved in cell wall biosynthesis/SAM-dependent methyltransferase